MKKKKEKLKVGRPKKADKSLKKKSYIMLGISAFLVLILLSGTLVSLNILPMFGKMKGQVTCSLSDIPEDLKPGGLHDYGFDDPNFYSAVVSAISNNTSCDVTPEQLATIKGLNITGDIVSKVESANGIQYLTAIDSLSISDQCGSSGKCMDSMISKIDLSHNTELKHLILDGSNLTEINLSNNSKLCYLDLENNNLSGVLDLNNINFQGWCGTSSGGGDASIYLGNNNLTGITNISGDLSGGSLELLNNNISGILDLSNVKVSSLRAENNKITEIVGLENQTDLFELFVYNNKLQSLNLNSSDELETLIIHNNPMMSTRYVLKGNEIDYNPITLNDNFTIATEISDESIISLSNNKLKGINEGVSLINLSNSQIESYNSVYMTLSDSYYMCGSTCSLDDLINDYISEHQISRDDVQNILNNPTTNIFFSQEIKVYDITSDKYSIDKDKKEISYSGEFNKDNVVLTLEGLTGEVDGTNYIIKDGDTTVDTYTLVNMKSSTTDNLSSSNKKDIKVDTTKKDETTTTKKKDSKETTTESKKEEETTTSVVVNKVVEDKSKNNTKEEVKESKSPIIPIAVGVGGIGAITGIGYGIYLLKIK